MAGASSGLGLGASHAIGHTLGGGYGVPHGLTSSVILPAVLLWNQSVAPERQRLVARLMGQNDLSAAETVKDFARRLGLPVDLAAAGIHRDQLRDIAEHTLNDRGVRSNPRKIKTAEDIMEILELALGQQ